MGLFILLFHLHHCFNANENKFAIGPIQNATGVFGALQNANLKKDVFPHKKNGKNLENLRKFLRFSVCKLVFWRLQLI